LDPKVVNFPEENLEMLKGVDCSNAARRIRLERDWPR
jgi:hypothetical protein